MVISDPSVFSVTDVGNTVRVVEAVVGFVGTFVVLETLVVRGLNIIVVGSSFFTSADIVCVAMNVVGEKAFLELLVVSVLSAVFAVCGGFPVVCSYEDTVCEAVVFG